MMINIIFDYVTIEIYSCATHPIALQVGNPDQRLCSKMPIPEIRRNYALRDIHVIVNRRNTDQKQKQTPPEDH
jgi:hypothetical protein